MKPDIYAVFRTPKKSAGRDGPPQVLSTDAVLFARFEEELRAAVLRKLEGPRVTRDFGGVICLVSFIIKECFAGFERVILWPQGL